MRKVFCEDAVEWLKSQPELAGCSLVASLPDISEFPHLTLSEWQEWFSQTAKLILSKTPSSGVTIFYQSDIKREGHWVDKGFLIQKAAQELNHHLLFHKIVCRAPAGQATFGRPAYSHLLAFSQRVTLDVSKSTADVIPQTGEKTWVRGMGLDTCLIVAKFIAEQTETRTIVNPFCGQGSVLAAGNHLGLEVIGIERSPNRAQKARELQISADGSKWNINEKWEVLL